MQAIGAWMKENGDSIYDTAANPLGPVTWGRITAKPGRLYLHVFDWPQDGKLMVPAKKVKGKASAGLLSENTGGGWTSHRGLRPRDQRATAGPDRSPRHPVGRHI